jgi:hypothetical protein
MSKSRTPPATASRTPRTAEDIAAAVTETAVVEPALTTFSEDTAKTPRPTDANNSMGIIHYLQDWIRLQPVKAALVAVALFLVIRHLRSR